MVFFVCEGCNETLKKNKVDQHAARCHNCWAVSCVDCSVVFKGNDYATHTSCISEAQKYQGALYKGKAKKQSPQERWMDIVQNTTSEDSKIQNVLGCIASYDNVPRKKAKFVNFMKNSIAMHDATMIEKVWTLYHEAINASQASTEQVSAAPSTSVSESSSSDATANLPAVTAEENSENKKRKESKENTQASNKKQKKISKEIKWSKVIKSALKNTNSNSMELKELKDKIISSILKKDPTRDEKELKKELKNALKTLSNQFETVEVIKLIKINTPE
jgi:cell growth-regulating nucleolar protein